MGVGVVIKLENHPWLLNGFIFGKVKILAKLKIDSNTNGDRMSHDDSFIFSCNDLNAHVITSAVQILVLISRIIILVRRNLPAMS